MEENIEVESSLADATSEDLKGLTKEVADLKKEIETAEVSLKIKKEKLLTLSNMILRTLDLLELENIRAHGLLFYRETKSSVQTPKTPEDKEKLFEFLRKKGIFLEFASVNSQSLNSLYKSLSEEAAKNGNYDFKLPGVGEATMYTSLKLRKG